MTNCAPPGPRRLSRRQREALDAVIACKGNAKRAADSLGVTLSTLDTHLCCARLRMNAPTRLWMFVEWDRLQRKAA